MNTLTQLAESLADAATELGMRAERLPSDALPAEAIVCVREAHSALERAKEALNRTLRNTDRN